MRIPIASSFACLDCESICEDPRRCDCGSANIFALSPILNRSIPDRTLVIDASSGMTFAGRNVVVDWVRQWN